MLDGLALLYDFLLELLAFLFELGTDLFESVSAGPLFSGQDFLELGVVGSQLFSELFFLLGHFRVDLVGLGQFF